MNKEIKINGQHFECSYDFDYIISVVNSVRSCPGFRFFDEDDVANTTITKEFVCFEKGRKGMVTQDLFGLNTKNKTLSILESKVQNNSRIISIDMTLDSIISKGTSLDIKWRNDEGQSAVSDDPQSTSHQCYYSTIKASKPDINVLSDRQKTMTYPDGTKLIYTEGNDSMGDWYYLETASGKRLAGGYMGVLDPIYFHKGVLFFPVCEIRFLDIKIFDCKTDNNICIIPAPKEIRIPNDIVLEPLFYHSERNIYQIYERTK